MALTVTTDLVPITTAEVITGWSAIGAQSAVIEPDFYVQGSNCVSRAVSGVGVVKGMVFDHGSGIDFTTGTHKDKLVYVWLKVNTAQLADTRAAAGVTVRLCTTSATADYREWNVDGKDSLPATDGWICYVIDPQSAGTTTSGSYSAASVRFYGGTLKTTTSAKGQNLGIDQISYGRGEVYVSGTVTTAGEGFKEIAAVAYDAAGSNRWGAITEKAGVFYVRGKIILGHATANTTFSSRGEVIVWESPSYYNGTNVVKSIPDASVGATAGADGKTTYNGIGFIGGSGTTTVDFGVIVGADSGRSGPALSCALNSGLTTPGRSLATVTVDNSTMALSLYAAIFAGFEGQIDLTGTGIAGDDCFSCTFNGCGRIDSNMEIRNVNVLNSVAVATDGAMLWNSATNVGKAVFANNSRAVVFESSTGTPFAFNNITFGGNTFDIRNEATDGDITVNINGGTTPTKEDVATSTTTVASASRTVKLSVVDVDGVAVTGARAFLRTSASGALPYLSSVTSITRVTTLATVTQTAHGMENGDKVLFAGITDKVADNAVFTVTKTGANTYTYPTTDSGSTNYAGTITATFVFLNGLANTGTGSNEISMSRAISAGQSVIGWARKASGAPLYKTGPVAGSVSSTADTSFVAVMISDD